MHHFIFPSKDTYLTNRNGVDDKNFGLDEQLQIGTSNEIIRQLVSTKEFVYTSLHVVGYPLENFSGTVLGSFIGTATVFGTISGSNLRFTASYFSGNATASLVGNYNGNAVNSSSFTGSVNGFGGAISGSAVGFISGSLTSVCGFGVFDGQLTGSSGTVTGIITGIDTRTQQHFENSTVKFIDRSMLKFDLSSISQSISNGSISNPKFTLNLRVSDEQHLPITYNIYAFPVSQSWEMGNGVFSDDGSEEGASWLYKDFKSGKLWYEPRDSGSRPLVDYINHSNFATGSFAFGGGTWYYSSSAGVDMKMVQAFNYEASDIKMDVTPIVNAWLTGSLPNEGFILLSSDEIAATGSGFELKFYSKDTNSIYSPYLDVSWSDFVFVTGSRFTSSVDIIPASGTIFSCFTSGDIIGASITGSISGSFTSSYYNGFNITGSITAVFTSGSLSGSTVYGTLSGSWDGISLSGSFINGNVSGSYFTGSSNGTSSLGDITGTYPVSGSCLSGSASGSTFVAFSTSSLLAGIVNGVYDNGQVRGVYTSGLIAGSFITGNVIGSYITSSFQIVTNIGTSSLNPLQLNRPFTIVVENLNREYKAGNFVRIGVFGRKQFPLKTFGKSTQQEQYLVPEYLPSSSFYAIKDNESEEIILDFDNYTQISCDPIGNYFILDTTGFAQERYYRILIKTEQSGSVYVIDNGNVFKITR